MMTTITQTKKRYPAIIRWIMPMVWLVVLLGTGIYFATGNLIHYVIDWKLYNSEGNYHAWADKIMKVGALQIRGSETSLHSSVLIGLLLLGALVSLAIFAFAWRTYYARTLMPLLAVLGFIIPFLIPAENNTLVGLVMGGCFIHWLHIDDIFTEKSALKSN